MKNRIIILGNYVKDKNISMNKFSQLLHREIVSPNYSVTLISPMCIFGKLPIKNPLMSKWISYIDKMIVFPIILNILIILNRASHLHICDHSNAFYRLAILSSITCSITCHDLLSVRASLGEDTDCKSSGLGSVLNMAIVHGLRHANVVPCVSKFTKADAIRIIKGNGERFPVIYNGLNRAFRRQTELESMATLSKIDKLNLNTPFILHVGSNHKRKNRALIIRALAEKSCRNSLQLVIAGEPLDHEGNQLALDLNVSNNIIEIIYPNDEIIEALYSRALALVLPSRYEGFGWPLIEAQACGCPVVCSDISPFIEIGGPSVIMSNPNDSVVMAEKIISLTDKYLWKKYQNMGYVNVIKFNNSAMINQYAYIFNKVLDNKAISLI